MHKIWLDFDYKTHLLGQPVSCSRPVKMENSTVRMSQAFDLPTMEIQPIRVGEFIGDIESGGSCNVRHLSFCPHNLTHIETPNHVVNAGKTLNEYHPRNFQGVAYLLDLSKETRNIECITTAFVKQRFDGISRNIDMLAIKSHFSKQNWDKNFSGQDPLFLDPNFVDFLNSTFPNLKGLLVDLPSLDKEDDGGKLEAHNTYFGNRIDKETGSKRFVVELAYFDQLDEGLYYTVLTPSKLQLDAIITDLFLYPMHEKSKAI